MAEIRKADPAARRQAVILIVLGMVVGAALILVFEHYRAPLRDWLESEPGETAHRVKLALILAATVMTAPVIVCALYLWSQGAAVVGAQQFPPPGYPVIRDTPMLGGRAAVIRGRALQVIALTLVVASVVLCLLLWRLASRLGA